MEVRPVTLGKKPRYLLNWRLGGPQLNGYFSNIYNVKPLLCSSLVLLNHYPEDDRNDRSM
jgi:hypothetical protein